MKFYGRCENDYMSRNPMAIFAPKSYIIYNRKFQLVNGTYFQLFVVDTVKQDTSLIKNHWHIKSYYFFARKKFHLISFSTM